MCAKIVNLNNQTYTLNKKNLNFNNLNTEQILSFHTNTPNEIKQIKEYHKSFIVHSHSSMNGTFFAHTPRKNGTGSFSIIDNMDISGKSIKPEEKIVITGKINKGQVTAVGLFRFGNSLKLSENVITDILDRVKSQNLSLRNLTVVYLKKILEFIRKV